MGIVLGLLSAACYGASDFLGGIGGRRSSSGAVAMVSQPMGLVAALLALLLFHGQPPGAAPLWWGALGGVGGGVGTVMLYRGLTVGRMGVVSPLSAVVTALVPGVVGLLTGSRPSWVVLTGMALALPAIALVSWHGEPEARGSSGIGYALAAGGGFALMFIALDRAGTASGAWPLVPGQMVALLVVFPVALSWSRGPVPWRAAAGPGLVAGSLGGAANLLFLAATGGGELAVVAVLTSLYPAVTVFLARLLLHERWRHVQRFGLAVSVAAVVLITVG